jgi:hypothetical protein
MRMMAIMYVPSTLLSYVRDTLQHRTGLTRIGKPGRRSSEGDEGTPGLTMN